MSVRKNTHRHLHSGKRCCHFFSAVFDRILFIFARNDNIYTRMDEFDILLYLTRTPELAAKYELDPIFSITIYPIHFKLVCMISKRSTKFSQIRQGTMKLSTLERLKIPNIRIMLKTALPLFICYF